MKSSKNRTVDWKGIDKKVEDLLAKMTLREKINQTISIVGEKILENGRFSQEKAAQFIGEGVGEISYVNRSMEAREGAEVANEIQRFVLEKTRLGIPVIIHDECLHGCMAKGCTSFPQSIAMASTWNPDLIKEVAAAIGRETSARGINHALSPTINIARDVRCGRTQETYGEDVYLTSKMALAFVEGIQKEKVVATVKHFAANFVGDGGRDSYAVHPSERILREVYLPAFKACIQKANALSVMAAYNSVGGVPCSCNKWLLSDILKKEWGFKGFVMSDYNSIPGIYDLHKVAATKAEAAQKAMDAGLDMELPNVDCYDELYHLVEDGGLSEKVIDEAVRRILRVKFWLGLFDNPYVKPDYAENICNCKNHRQLSLQVAREGIVLLKNTGTLPLSKQIKSVAVIGPNANEERLGDYSGEGMKVVKPLEGIKNKIAKSAEVYFAEGCKITGDSRNDFEDAVKAARKAEAVIFFAGNYVGTSDDATEGEGRDRCNLDLPGVQEELIKKLCATGKPVVVVLINGSAVTMARWLNDVQAVVEAWYPGEEGGNAIADVLFGDYNPAGRLPITFPKTTGQLPFYYNCKPSGRTIYDYIDLRGEQSLFPFGYGLSYTRFEYSKLEIKPEKTDSKGTVTVSFELQNVGNCRGEEVAQLYIHDTLASMARPLKELKGFKKVLLELGEKKEVEFILEPGELSFLDHNLNYVTEPGIFEAMIGSSSEDIKLKGTFQIT